MLRIAVRLGAMALWLAVAVVCFTLWRLFGARNPWPRLFLGGIARLAGVRVRTTGRPAGGQLMILANHVSWIDIAALSRLTGTAFVAHDGLAVVPALRWLCAMNDTVFIARDARATIAAQIDTLRAALIARGTLTVFPEGTTSDGTTLGPFKSALLAALDPLPAGLAVQPVWLDYGAHVATIAWVGAEPGVANFKRIVARASPLELTVHFLDPLPAASLTSRKVIARAAHDAIMAAMALQKPRIIA